MRKKVTVVGSGAVGSTAAHWIASKELADDVLTDIVQGLPQGIALDLAQSGPVEGFDLHISGANSYETTADSDVIVFTAGVPRRKDPVTGQFPSRDDLVKINQDVVSKVTEELVKAEDRGPGESAEDIVPLRKEEESADAQEAACQSGQHCFVA